MITIHLSYPIFPDEIGGNNLDKIIGSTFSNANQVNLK